jgi:hypothetical protein
MSAFGIPRFKLATIYSISLIYSLNYQSKI